MKVNESFSFYLLAPRKLKQNRVKHKFLSLRKSTGYGLFPWPVPINPFYAQLLEIKI